MNTTETEWRARTTATISRSTRMGTMITLDATTTGEFGVREHFKASPDPSDNRLMSRNSIWKSSLFDRENFLNGIAFFSTSFLSWNPMSSKLKTESWRKFNSYSSEFSHFRLIPSGFWCWKVELKNFIDKRVPLKAHALVVMLRWRGGSSVGDVTHRPELVRRRFV